MSGITERFIQSARSLRIIQIYLVLQEYDKFDYPDLVVMKMSPSDVAQSSSRIALGGVVSRPSPLSADAVQAMVTSAVKCQALL